MLRVGSLCSGYLGLDIAVESVFDCDLAWVSEVEPAACQVIERRAPNVPNLGDLKEIDWGGASDSLAVDVLTAGYP